MSYDVYLEARTGPDSAVEAYWANYTSNMSPAWRAAGVDIAEFDGKTAEEFGLALDRAIERIEAAPEEFKKFEPDNGWGSVNTMLRFLKGLSDACREHPWATVRVSN
jgi:hypothetical protein